jgi:tRNA threonylcarbamoyl adenosine modification protein YeaZ
MLKKSFILALETSSRIGSVAIACGENLLAEATFSGPLRHSPETFPAISSLLERFGKKPHEIEHIYISVGPGSFTGLRIAVTIAKTMHLANATKIVAVDSLDVIAANIINLTQQTTGHERRAASYEKIAAILDAKRNQFFIAVYECLHSGYTAQSLTEQRASGIELPFTNHHSPITNHEIWQKILPDSLMSAPEFLKNFAAGDPPIWLLGDGLLFYKDKFKADGVRFLDEKYWSPRAEKVHLLGWQLAQSGQFADPLTLTPNYLLRPDIKIKPR